MQEDATVFVSVLESAGAAARIDTSYIITELPGVAEAQALPSGSVVGDGCGGLTFTDAVAAALEARSSSGWREIDHPSGQIWTVIVVS